jgi:intracellular septation protein A
MSEQPHISTPNPKQTPQKNENMLANLAFNIIIPVLLMSYASKPEYLGPLWSIAVALAFPISYGTYELVKSKKWNFFSILGIVSVLLTGTISLLKLPAEYIAIKEAAIPGLIGIAVLVSRYMSKPLIKVLVLNDAIINWPALDAALEKNNATAAFEKKIDVSNYIVACSFFLSSALNYGLAKWILVSEPGTTAYTEELGRMTALSYPVIVLPSMILLLGALFYIFSQMKKLTGEDVDAFMHGK